jgi:indole-3-glycerol phosphate synthase
VVTEEKFFYGSKEYLTDIRAAIDLPILRKDFLINTDQVVESFNLGADMVLFIVACLSDGELFELDRTARELGMTPIVEIHDESELGRALSLGPVLLGINNRNLADFAVDLDKSMNLKEIIPSGIPVISESGIQSAEHVKALKRAGFAGMLVGEALLRQPDCGAALREMIHG